MTEIPNAQAAEEQFARKDYKMTVHHDTGVYRHLEFRHDNQHAYSFHITTWPGALCYSGDMGCFVFERLRDMVHFFSGKHINPSYWSEKLQSCERGHKSSREFSPKAFREQVEQEREYYLEDYEGEELESRSTIFDDAFDDFEHIDNEHEAVQLMWNLDIDIDLCEFFPTDQYTFSYAYACLAIHFACNHYLGSVPARGAGDE